MKPDWKDAPEKANFLALDYDGEWWWFENRPDCGTNCWRNPKGGGWHERAKTKDDIWWEASLEPRPAAIGESCESLQSHMLGN